MDVSSAAKRKLVIQPIDLNIQAPAAAPLPTTVVNLNTLSSLLSGQLCGECCGNDLSLKRDSSKDQYMAVYLSVFCNDCKKIISETWTSEKIPSSPRIYDVNKRVVVASLATGMGYSGLAKFTEYMNMPTINQKTHQGHLDKMEVRMSEEVIEILKKSAARVKEAYGKKRDITVSFDGSWMKRGHTSRLGIGVVIDVKTGLVLDFHVMSTYCQQCSATGVPLKEDDPGLFEEWAALHKSACTINFHGSSGAMEVEAAKVMWSRSEELHGLRYTRVLSDGDAKTLSALQAPRPYADVDITKEECINHVAKRLKTHLRNLVSTENKRGVRLGGAAKGSLTQTKIGLLQSYFTKAVRTHNNSVQEMADAIWAGYYHSVSTDDSPQHDLCSPDWCLFKRAIMNGDSPPSHSGKITKTFLNTRVAPYVKPIYAKLTDPVLLERCLLGITQNANESLHSTIWNISDLPLHLTPKSE